MDSMTWLIGIASFPPNRFLATHIILSQLARTHTHSQYYSGCVVAVYLLVIISVWCFSMNMCATNSLLTKITWHFSRNNLISSWNTVEWMSCTNNKTEYIRNKIILQAIWQNTTRIGLPYSLCAPFQSFFPATERAHRIYCWSICH